MKPVTRLLIFLVCGMALHAGQSIILTSQVASNASVPAVNSSSPWLREGYLDVITSPLSVNPTFLTNDPATGLVVELVNGCNSLCFLAYVGSETGQSPFPTCIAEVGNTSTHAIYWRFQHAALSDSCEVWDTNGVRIVQNTSTFTANTLNSAGTNVIGGADGEHWAFVRTCSGATLALGSKMPTTAGGCPVGTTVVEWKFDNSLNDSSGNGYTATLSTGSAVYAATNHQTALAVIKTANAPAWSNWISMRAGFPNALDGTGSFSQADATASVTCFWQALSGPSTPVWSSHSSCTPVISGLVFGNYRLQLTVTDSGGLQATDSFDIGAVAMDSNGVVINANPAADQLFGPMIAFGKNPWGLQDKLAKDATTTRSAAYSSVYTIPPTWDTALPGTVNYAFIRPTGTTFSGSCAATAATCTVADAAQLDLTSFPTIIFAGGGTGEYMRVCSAAGNVLTFCYDGRGYRFGTPSHQAATTWANGTTVQQHKVTGSGTSLLATFNPLGAGWSGLAISTAGTCGVTHNSTSIIGSGTNWTSIGNTGFAIRISGHHSGTPFEFFAYVSSVTDATHLTVNRVYPNDADDESGLVCSTFKPDIRNAVLHYARCGSGSNAGCVGAAFPYDGYTYFTTDGCESDTACYIYGGFDPDSVKPAYSTCMSNPPYQNTLMQCGVHISYMDSFGYVGDNNGINFYDEGLAHMAFYLRSGWQPALDAFRKVEGQQGTNNNGYMFYPEMTQGDIGGIPRRASVLGMWAAYLLDGKTSNLQGLRKWANNAIVNLNNFANNQGCNNDLREGIGYPLQWLAAAALWDPDAIALGYRAALASWYSTYSPCANTGSALLTNSWANGFDWADNQTVALTATNGSRIVTGTGIAPGICGTTPSGTGTATVTNGSDVVTGSGFVAGGGKIMFEDSVLGLLSFNYIFDGSSQIHLSGMYPGASASGVTWWISTDSSFNGTGFDSVLVFATSNTDPQLKKQWDCRWNHSGQITLDRPWDGPTTSSLHGWRGNLGGIGLAGYGQQPFFLGVNVLGHRLASLQSGPTGTNFNTLGNNAATWIKTYGYDPTSGGSYYGRIFAACEPVYADSSQPQNFPEGYRNPQCSYNGSSVPPNYSKQIARVNSAEMQNAAGISFANDPSSANRAFWDKFYANIWDLAPYTRPGFGSDGLGTLNCGPSNNFAFGKWTGFCFGLGMSHQWPAARLGGVAPAEPRTMSIGFNLASVANATKVRVILTRPDGLQVTNTCTASPCAVTADARQGDHLLKLEYLNTSDVVLARSDQLVLRVN